MYYLSLSDTSAAHRAIEHSQQRW